MKLKVRDKPKGHTLRSRWKEALSLGSGFGGFGSSDILSLSVVMQLTLIVLVCASSTQTNLQARETSSPNHPLTRLRVRRQIFRQNIPTERPLTGNAYAEHHGFPHPGRWHEQPQSIKPANPNSGHHFENQNVIITDEDFKRYGSTLMHIDEMIYQMRLREQPHLYQQPQSHPHPQQQQQYQQPPQHLELDLMQHHPPPPPPVQHQHVPSNYGPPPSHGHAHGHGPVSVQYLPPPPQHQHQHQHAPPPPPPPGPTGSFQPSYFPPPHPHQQQHPPQHNFLQNHPGLEYGQIQLVPDNNLNHAHAHGPGSGPSPIPPSGPSGSYGPPSAPETEIVHHGTPNPVIPVVAHFHYTHHAGEVKGERTVKFLPGSHVTHGPPSGPSPSPQYGPELRPQYGPGPVPAPGPPVPIPSPQYGAELRPQYGAPGPAPAPKPPSPQYGAELNLPQYNVLGPDDDIHSSGPGPTFYGPPPAPAHASRPVKPIRHHHHHESSFHRFKGPSSFNIRRPKHFSSSTSYGGYLPARRPVRYSLRTPGSYSWSVSY